MALIYNGMEDGDATESGDPALTGTLNLDNAPEFKRLLISSQSDPPADSVSHFHLDGFGWQIYHRAVTK